MNCCCHHAHHQDCIDRVPIFSSLSPGEKLEIARITSARTFQKGEMIYSAGDPGGKLYVLHTGTVKISRINAGGKEQVIRVVGPGDFMGELSLFSSAPLSDNAEALEATTLCMIDGARLRELMAKYTSIAFKILEELSRRLEKAENLIESISLNSVEQRLAQALLSLSEGGHEVVLSMKKGDLASQLGMSQETLSRKLATFQEQGLITLMGHKRIVIRDRAGLERLIAE
ncbi:MAG TPA: Crp/Fnr family transcriptional regulator [Thermoclostridium caenicola]|uniref:Crp/Fnr family transcriptional regulator n=1 Tax=Thermoclostridium caenicola TaxID=659425 RepID=UPI002C306C01|nr:Crp/Fnr family transcriptional regulator [Thermoclostridium caenicola]HOK42987.1 Crp/Fnr family transcriptional regulator [Thermoclostridium caenicola]HOL85096.1 Crp/Fnr family transcriptional regulator [Thermoclostridium caenicola]HPO77509.1 Crp/Fnr family transcriptional regulator [Thermoclostridium caenicola]